MREHWPDDLIADLTNDAGMQDIGSKEVLLIEDALLRASSVIDSYIGGRYTVPLATVPASIRDACCTIALVKLYWRRRQFSYPADLKDEYAQTIEWLKMLARGETVLAELEPELDPETTQSARAVVSATKIFTKDVLDTYG